MPGLEKKLRREIAELTALYEVGKAMASNLDFAAVASRTLEILSEHLAMKRGTLTLLDPPSGQLAIAAAYGLTVEEIRRGKYRIGEGVTGKVVEKGQPMIVPDIGKDPLFLNRTRARGDLKRQNISFLCVPVKVKGETLGVLSVDRLFTDDVSLEEDVRTLTVVASLVGQNLMLHRLIEEEKTRLIEEKRGLESELRGKYRLENIIGESKAMKDVYRMVHQVSPTRSNVMIRGEFGTGKELVARAIHYNSGRSDRPFVQVSCAGLPEALLESELFGHEKGSFTGAVETVKGRIEAAEGGTLFLDEVGDIPLSTQVKLLRVLQDRKFERVGGTKTLTSDVRIVAATQQDLEQAVAQGRFREDLYYRVNVVLVFLPPLRERSEDIPLLVEHFLHRYNRENGADLRITHGALERLVRHDWPGNVRELENAVERMAVMAKGPTLDVDDIPDTLGLLDFKVGVASGRAPSRSPAAEGGTLADLEKRRVIQTMEQYGWVQARACKALGITPRQLGYKLKKYNIEYRPTLSH